MVTTNFDRWDELGRKGKLYIEANANQELLYRDEFAREEQERGYFLPIREDNARKDNKESRIENLTPFFERGLITFNEAERKNPDMLTFIS